MVSQAPTPFDPELEQILRDIAKDPRSSLLRVQRPPRPASLADSWESISHRTPGLTAAEKHLLQTHRAETALLLRQRWLHENAIRPPKRFSLLRESSGAGDIVADQRNREQVRGLLLADGRSDLASVLLDIDEDRQMTAVALTGLLVAAEKLNPTMESKLMLAQDLVINEQPRSAIVRLRKVLHEETRHAMKGYIWHNLGFATGSMGDLEAAFICYARATQVGTPTLPGTAQWLLMSVQTGNVPAALEAASFLEDIAGRHDPRLLAAFCQEHRRTRTEGSWVPTKKAAKAILKVRELVGPNTQKVIHVLE